MCLSPTASFTTYGIYPCWQASKRRDETRQNEKERHKRREDEIKNKKCSMWILYVEERKSKEEHSMINYLKLEIKNEDKFEDEDEYK